MRVMIIITLLALVSVRAWAGDSTETDVKLVTNAREISGCGETIAAIKDDDPKDLKRKAAKKGGTHVLLTSHGVLGGSDPLVNPFHGDRQVMTGLVYRCPMGWVPPQATSAPAEDSAALQTRVKLLEERVDVLERWIELLKQPKEK